MKLPKSQNQHKVEEATGNNVIVTAAAAAVLTMNAMR
jgi:hypothetical protein